jgi:ribonuclease P protein component
MLQAQNRLRHDQDFKTVFSSGKSVFDSICGIKFAKNKHHYSRFAVVVGTKVSKSAVVRNRVRRQYRAILRENLDKIQPGFDVILLTSKAAVGPTAQEKREKLLLVLKKARLLV